MDNNKVRIGIIGCGGIANEHLRGYSQCNSTELIAVVDIVGEKAKEIGDRSGAKWYADYKELLDKEKLDGVSICTPPNSHKQIVIDAIRKGLHVLCEKPLTITATDAQEIVNMARDKNVILMTAFCHRFHEPVMKVKQLIGEGKLGDILMFRNRFGGKGNMAEKWFSKKGISGGGTFMDTSVHSVDLFRWLVGEVRKVTASIRTYDQRMNVEDCGIMLLESENGALGTIEASWSTPWSENIIEIYGSKGAAIIDYNKIELRYRLEDSPDWVIPKCELPDRFVLETKHFVECIRGKKKPIVDGKDGLKAAVILEAAYRSAQEGKSIKVN